MLTCKEFFDIVSIDREPSIGEYSALINHLFGCAKCRFVILETNTIIEDTSINRD